MEEKPRIKLLIQQKINNLFRMYDSFRLFPDNFDN